MLHKHTIITTKNGDKKVLKNKKNYEIKKRIEAILKSSDYIKAYQLINEI